MKGNNCNRNLNKKQQKELDALRGLGSHHEVSPMGHATQTKTRQDKLNQEERKLKQNDYDE